jgi:hypothetical protein
MLIGSAGSVGITVMLFHSRLNATSSIGGELVESGAGGDAAVSSEACSELLGASPESSRSAASAMAKRYYTSPAIQLPKTSVRYRSLFYLNT